MAAVTGRVTRPGARQRRLAAARVGRSKPGRVMSEIDVACGLEGGAARTAREGVDERLGRREPLVRHLGELPEQRILGRAVRSGR